VTTVAELLAARADDDAPGLWAPDGVRSWRDVVAASAARGVLIERLARPGPRHVGVLLPNVAEYAFWLGGAALSGATVVGLNPTRRGGALAADVAATDCQLIVTDEAGRSLLEGLETGVTEDRLLATGGDAYARLLAEATPAAGDGLVERAGSVPPDQLFVLLFTSGTTGTPKAVRCTQGRLAGIARAAGPGYGLTTDDVCYCPMPLFHGNALMTIWGPALMLGATLALPAGGRFSASGFIDEVRRAGATTFSYVGKAIAYVLATPERPDDDDNPLRQAFGTEASVGDRREFERRFACRLFEGYGSSEGGAAINLVPDTPSGSLGRPVGGADIAVVDPGSGQELAPARVDEHGRLLNASEAIGEIVNRGGTGGFEGYYRAPDAEASRTRNGWYWTGDLGYRDEAGFFYFAGRSGDWLRVDSENFAAGPVEAIVSRHPDVSVVAVYPVPDTRSGDQVAAALELRPGAEFDPAAFAEWLGAQPDLGTKWTPRYVRLCPVLPQTATGKVTKVTLRAEGWHTADPVYWRPGRQRAYRLLTADDRRHLDAELARGRGRDGA